MNVVPTKRAESQRRHARYSKLAANLIIRTADEAQYTDDNLDERTLAHGCEPVLWIDARPMRQKPTLPESIRVREATKKAARCYPWCYPEPLSVLQIGAPEGI
jgi:hypothetical protein